MLNRQEIDRELNEPRVVTKLDPQLKAVDQLCDLWSRQAFDHPGGSMHPIKRLMLLREGAVFGAADIPMAPNVCALDAILVTSDPRYYSFCVVWYVERGTPIIVKAKKLNTNRTDLYHMWRRTLEYLKGRLDGEGVVLEIERE